MTDSTPPDMPPFMDGGQDLEERLAAREEEISILNDKLLRLAAEMENVRRRLEKEKQDMSVFAVSNFARDLLSVADNLRRAVQAVPEAVRHDQAVNVVVTGVEMTERELMQIFTRYGIARIEAVGMRLDPHQHQAMGEIDSAAVEPGTVAVVLQDGYMLKDRLLRPAMVMLAKGNNNADETPGNRINTVA